MKGGKTIMIILKILSSPATQISLKSVGKPLLSKVSPFVIRTQCLADSSRSAFRRAGIGVRRRTMKETLLQPAGDTAFDLGKGVVAGASVFGLGALCYYGLGLSNQPGAIDQSVLWPSYVKERIRDTYMYFGGSIALTAASAAAVFRSPVLFRLVASNSWLAIGASIAAMIGSGIIVRSIPYSEGLGVKQLAWAAHSGIMGAVIAPLCLLGGPLLIRAAWYTAGIVGGLSTVAVCAPSEKFLNMGGPLAIGLGVVFAASLGSMFLPPTTALGAGIYSISLYGGLLLFSGFLLFDTQRIIKKAEMYPMYGMKPFDPINASISIYLDTINIFIRIATILAGGGSRKK
ncbi:growth hormone-inducible transmembrane protein-like isoform X3 [Centruroides sculpturatus]|uniref:growth hormone-inducible transmembrane protein-like isoform X3 n=1 Tax=Centruroides sculpturatus TaxID=218467 RepID=UPI000C6EA5AE|nr:growth hormone-inducible transmembrane protein-like isoform X3 [Centruroides sculpturatus]